MHQCGDPQDQTVEIDWFREATAVIGEAYVDVTAAATRRKRDILESLARLVSKIIGTGTVGSMKSVSGGL
jgi:hypothetical protein